MIRRTELCASHFSFPFYPYDHFSMSSDVYCYQPSIFKNNLFSFEFFSLFHGSVKLRQYSKSWIHTPENLPTSSPILRISFSFTTSTTPPLSFSSLFHPSLRLPLPFFFPTSLQHSCKRIFDIMKWDNSTNYFALASSYSYASLFGVCHRFTSFTFLYFFSLFIFFLNFLAIKWPSLFYSCAAVLRVV